MCRFLLLDVVDVLVDFFAVLLETFALLACLHKACSNTQTHAHLCVLSNQNLSLRDYHVRSSMTLFTMSWKNAGPRPSSINAIASSSGFSEVALIRSMSCLA